MENLEPVISKDYRPLTDDEIEAFFQDIDRNNDGHVNFEELEKKLHEVHEEIAPNLQGHHILHPARRDAEKRISHDGDGLHAFLCHLMPECGAKVSKEEFVRHVKTWEVPSQKQSDAKEADKEAKEEEKKLPFRRRLRAYWAVHGPNILFVAFVVACMIAFGVWQMVVYIENQPARQALGWGVIMAKANAGVLYPTFVFMLLSMSRHLSTFLRRSWLISRVVNWDLSQKFHIIMSVAGLLFATLHAIGHLTGSFLYGSRASNLEDLTAYLGPEATPKRYVDFVRTLPGCTGIVSIGLFWTISLMSMPFVRNWNYEVFQLAHLLMFPLIGLLAAHGTAAILQAPMLGYFLAFPALLVIFERLRRFIRGFMSMPAKLKVLDDDAVFVTVRTKDGKDWSYNAGQYLLLQVPQLSLFQWHPFTISSCRGNEMQVHIKVEGDWTEQLRDLALKQEDIKIGIDGPFGGIGITPFSAILTDLEESYKERRDPWESRRSSRSLSRGVRSRRSSRHFSRSRRSFQASTPVVETDNDLETKVGTEKNTPNDSDANDTNPAGPPPRCINPERRVDFHWTVREKNNLLWFSDLLNRAIVGAGPLAEQNKLDLNINTHITAKRKNISTHVFRYILDGYRTEAAPYSALTGLKQRSHFGRPDFNKILEKHFQDLVDDGMKEKKVGVFYCGAPVVGEILSDQCHQLTAKARHMGLKIRYDFLMEVFD
ncbi:Putative EF-hand domain, ferric reductase, NAD binding domain, riboflavin synthase-like beta-barrel [Septoria linicola]|uniref:EF-hand domain, ferric reductase, NAD binding domain, riboflavin synthase-like beta-barrel n=1 Tax=Septoria linicola TaxID=215465 RepID=A0A9Q9AS06_9PEZI|nr:putative EF-hand domain, ferric reductase, NAD binding domain, riboflavin synthase-like beta-barrel [Septoria linicola]USW51088.1 Putative EF-hand domain, ferric reductase, NAD binding domain, riboflavin synthase-like beta-barrel [Septoria linicola]